MAELRIGAHIVLVDDADFELVSAYEWRVRGYYNNLTYAMTRIKRRTTMMHRLILGVTDRRLDVDHINSNGLDNRRCNMRVCTRSQNLMNARFQPGITGYRGVKYDPGRGARPYRARIAAGGKRIFGPPRHSAHEAARDYDFLSMKLHGEFGRPNGIEG